MKQNNTPQHNFFSGISTLSHSPGTPSTVSNVQHSLQVKNIGKLQKK